MRSKLPIVYVPLTGGLGNQLFQFAAALSLQNRKLCLLSNLGRPRLNSELLPAIASFTLPQNVNLFREKISPNFLTKVYGYVLRTGVSPRDWERTLFVKKLTILAASIILSTRYLNFLKLSRASGVGYSAISPTSNMVIGYFQTYRFAQLPHVNSKIRAMRFARESDIVQKYKNLSIDENPIVVHMRLGDYLTESNFGIPSEEYYRSAIHKLVLKFPGSRIWLFSDDPVEAQIKFPKELRHKLRIVEEVETDPAAILECMRFGIAYVIANSTFSWWGAYLSHSANPVVIFPSPWFQGMDEPIDLTPDTWISNPSF
ncbi:Fut1_Fut2_like domain containing protein [Candidatus Planktophila versatilis]|uniref:alpha-1,2-fucosyltransferase n=1 Tax=Candidatus Planktophila versatilis TaxID=1884905 RepID=UPI003BEECCCA